MVLPFKLSVVEDSNKAERALAKAVVDQVLKKKESLIGLATGQTMIGVYKTLVEEEKKNIGLFADTVFVQLDEIVPKAETDRLFSKELQEIFLNRLEGGYHSFLSIDILAQSLTDETSRHCLSIKRLGGIDLQILGIGVNGHIGYNEPGSDLNSTCRIVKLADETIKRSEYQTNTMGITLGIADILAAEKIVLLATGSSKAKAIEKTLRLPVSSDNPASQIINHKAVEIILDQSAAGSIT